MKIELYQSHWFNIDLQKLADYYKHPFNKVVDEKIYQSIYEYLLCNNFKCISQDWIKKKNALSNYLFEFFENNELKHSKILSVGCGLGIVEKTLIQKGFKIDLQECQDISIKYLKNNFPEEFQKINFINSVDLKDINDQSYNIAMAISSTYCLSDKILMNFLGSIHRIIDKNGFFIWYETALSLYDVFNLFKMKLRNNKPKGILWGWKRSLNALTKKAFKNGFKLINNCYLDENNKVIYPRNFMFLPIGKNVAWQMMVFKKND